VLVTVSDKKIVHTTNGTTIDYYLPDIVTANDYYPFGMMMPGRKYTANTTTAKYRFSINGQEKETDLNPNITTAEFWEYDSRIGRRWNRDPVVKEWESPYLCFSGNPIFYADPAGNEPDKPIKSGTYEGQQESTKQEIINARGDWVNTKVVKWNWHQGGVSQGLKYNKSTKSYEEVFSKSGWYTSDEYVDLLKPIASALAVDMHIYNGAAEALARSNYAANKSGLEKFVGTGLSDNASAHLIVSAQKTSSATNLSVSGKIDQTAFNVEDMLGVGLFFKGALKMLGTLAVKTLTNKEAAIAVLKNTVKDFVALFQPANEYDAVKTLFRGTTGSEGKGSFLFLTDDAAAAATYVKNGGMVMKYEVSNYALKNLEQRGMLQMLNDIHMIGGKQVYHNTYKFIGSNVREALNSIAKPQ
jgi:hypothetical protein